MFVIVAGTPPNCDTCGKPMDSWIAFAGSHTHTECEDEKCRRWVHDLFQRLRREMGLPVDPTPETKP